MRAMRKPYYSLSVSKAKCIKVIMFPDNKHGLGLGRRLMKGSERYCEPNDQNGLRKKYHIINKIQLLKAADEIQHAAGTAIDKNKAISFRGICISVRRICGDMTMSVLPLSAAHPRTVPRRACTAASLHSRCTAG